MKKIIGCFEKQEWMHDDEYIDIGSEDFDATSYILNMDYEDVIEITDCDDSSDVIGRAHVDWDGPCSVTELEESIAGFFGVDQLDEITEEMFDDAKKQYSVKPFVKKSISMEIKVDLMASPDINIHDVIKNLMVQIRSETPGAVVKNFEVTCTSDAQP